MKNEAPSTIGFICDGNRRYAKKRKIETSLGHVAGYEKLKEVVGWAQRSGIKEVVAYVFSDENWNRATSEVESLTSLFTEMIGGDMLRWAKENNVRLLFLGERKKLPPELIKAIIVAEGETQENSDITLAIALSYGGRAEMLDAIKRIPKESIANIAEEEFGALLWSHEICNPDLMIRTGGECRLSNFLLWQTAYSELFFIDTLWPDFTHAEFLSMLEKYQVRERKNGK